MPKYTEFHQKLQEVFRWHTRFWILASLAEFVLASVQSRRFTRATRFITSTPMPAPIAVLVPRYALPNLLFPKMRNNLKNDGYNIWGAIFLAPFLFLRDITLYKKLNG